MLLDIHWGDDIGQQPVIQRLIKPCLLDVHNSNFVFTNVKLMLNTSKYIGNRVCPGAGKITDLSIVTCLILQCSVHLTLQK